MSAPLRKGPRGRGRQKIQRPWRTKSGPRKISTHWVEPTAEFERPKTAWARKRQAKMDTGHFPATSKQKSFAASLAREKGVEPPIVETRREASVAIDALKKQTQPRA